MRAEYVHSYFSPFSPSVCKCRLQAVLVENKQVAETVCMTFGGTCRPSTVLAIEDQKNRCVRANADSLRTPSPANHEPPFPAFLQLRSHVGDSLGVELARMHRELAVNGLGFKAHTQYTDVRLGFTAHSSWLLVETPPMPPQMSE